MIGGAAIRTVAPTAMSVTLAELKAQCRYFEADEDATLVAYLRAAEEHIENYTGLGLITQVWTQTFPSFPTVLFGTAPLTFASPMKLFRRPLQAVLFVTYLDGTAIEQTLSDSVYRVSGIGQPYHAATLALNTAQAWPTTYAAQDAVTVTYRVGFGDTHNSVPELIRHAVLLTASTWFDYRVEIVMGATVAELPITAKTLLRDYRPLAIA